MRNDPVDIADCTAGSVENLSYRFLHRGNRKFEGISTVHFDKACRIRYRTRAERLRAPGLDPDRAFVVSRCPRKMDKRTAAAFRQHRGSGAVCEDNRRASVRPVDKFRQIFGSDHEGCFDIAGLHHCVRCPKSEQKARAGSADIEGEGLIIIKSQRLLNETGGAGRPVGRRDGRADDESDFLYVNSGILDGRAGSLLRKLFRIFSFRYIASFDSGPAADPFVRRLHKPAQLVVRH